MTSLIFSRDVCSSWFGMDRNGFIGPLDFGTRSKGEQNIDRQMGDEDVDGVREISKQSHPGIERKGLIYLSICLPTPLSIYFGTRRIKYTETRNWVTTSFLIERTYHYITRSELTRQKTPVTYLHLHGYEILKCTTTNFNRKNLYSLPLGPPVLQVSYLSGRRTRTEEGGPMRG